MQTGATTTVYSGRWRGKRGFNTLNATEELINSSSRLLDLVKPMNDASKNGKAESFDSCLTDLHSTSSSIRSPHRNKVKEENTAW